MPTVSPQVHRIAHAATLLQISQQTIRRLIASGKLQSIKISERAVGIPVASLDKYLSSLIK